MAERGDPSDTRTLEDTIKKNETKITELKGEVEKLQEGREKDQKEIKRLNKEIQRLEGENNTLNAKVDKLKKDIENLKQSNQNYELSEDQLVIRELCSKVQQNILKIVLKGNFVKFENKSTKYVLDYIEFQIKDKDEQEKAKARWEKLRKELMWKGYWIKILKPAKEEGNEVAHPTDMTVERINAAKENLKKKKKLSENMAKAVDHLKDALEQTNCKLPPEAGSAEGANQGGSRNVSDPEQKRVPARGRGDQRSSAKASNSHSTEGQDQGGPRIRSAPTGRSPGASIVNKGAQIQWQKNWTGYQCQ